MTGLPSSTTYVASSGADLNAILDDFAPRSAQFVLQMDDGNYSHRDNAPGSTRVRTLVCAVRYYALQRDSLSRGPVWSRRVGAAAHTHRGMCLASAVWNAQASTLYLAGNARTVSGQTYAGAIRAVSASTGVNKWATGLGCAVLGTPALDAATSVLAVATSSPCRNGSPAVYLLNAATGRILGTLPLNAGAFAQPVFAGQYLFVADESKGHTRWSCWRDRRGAGARARER